MNEGLLTNEKTPVIDAESVSPENSPLHIPHQVSPPENLVDVSSPMTPLDEIVPVGDAENAEWKKAVNYINKIDLEDKEKKKALVSLHGDKSGDKFIPGSVQVINKIERQLGEFSDDENTLTREERNAKHKLLQDQTSAVDREMYTKNFIDTKEDSIGGNIELALRNFDTLPEELRGAIRTGDKAIFAKYAVNTWAAKQVGRALEAREHAEEVRIHNESLAHKEALAKISDAIMAGESASFSRADIEEALQEKGISISNIGEGIRIFKEQYEQNNKRVIATPPTKEPRSLLERVRYATAQDETIPEHVIQSMLKSRVPLERAWAEDEIAKKAPVATTSEVVEVAVPTVAVEEVAVSPEMPTADGINVRELEVEEITIPPLASQEEQIESLRAISSRSPESRRLKGLALLADNTEAFIETKNEEVSPAINTPDVAVLPESTPQETVELSPTTPSLSSYDIALEKRWNERGEGIESSNWELAPMDEEVLSAEVAKMESLVVNNDVPPFMERKLRHTWEIVDEKYAAMDARADKVVETTPQSKGVKTTETVPINFAVAKQFQEKFGVDENSLSGIESFVGLTVGQQALVLKNLEQLTLSDITKEAKTKQKEEWGNTAWWKKGFQSIVTLGMKPDLRTAEIEKELLAKSRGENVGSVDGVERHAKKLAYIESLAKVAKAGPDVEINNGELLITYVSPKDMFESLDDKKLSGESLVAIEKFNATASDFAKIPHEWKYATTELKGKELTLFTEKKKAYMEARTALLSVFEEKFTADGEKDSEERAMLQMNELDERVQLNQLFNTHPDAEEALKNIRDKSIIRRAAKEFWKAKGNFIAYGIAGRAAVVSTVGVMIPPFGATVLALGAVTGAGYLVGKNIGNKEGERLMKVKRADGRMSTEDEREEIEYNKYQIENGKPVLDKEGNPVIIGVATRKIKEFTDATFFTDRIDRLVEKLGKTSDTKEHEIIEKKIAQTTMLMSEKLNHGMINFGGSALKKGDERKGDTIANRLSFIQAMAKGAIETAIDKEKLGEDIAMSVGLRESKIEESRKEETRRMAKKAALLRALFALAGASIADNIASHYMHPGSSSTPTSTPHDESAQSEVLARMPKTIENVPSDQIVSPEELAYASKMSVALNRPLSLIEARALWKTDVTFATPNPDFAHTPQSFAHTKLIDALIAKPSLSQAEITDIYKSVGFDEAKGNQFPIDYGTKLDTKLPIIEQAPQVPPVVHAPETIVPSQVAESASPVMLKPPQPEVVDTIPTTPTHEAIYTHPAEAAPRVPTIEESMQAVTDVESRINRDMSGGEMVAVKSLKVLEVNAKDPSDLANIGEARIALVDAMKAKGAVLSPTEMYNVMRQFSLETKVNIIPDAPLRKELFQ